MVNIKQLMEICLTQGLDGKKTDKCVQAIAINLLTEQLPVTPIQIDSHATLLHMMREADHPHLFVERGVFHFNALYSVTDKFPAPRIYFMKTPLLDEVAFIGKHLEQHGIKLPIVDSDKFSQLIEDKEYKGRYQAWRKQFEDKGQPFKGLFDGRTQNTVIENGIWLSSDGCLICGEKTDFMSTTSIIGGNGVMIGLLLCKEHEDDARNNTTLIEYISKKWGIPSPFFTNVKIIRHTAETVAMSAAAIQSELECNIEKVEGNTITAIRSSGFKIILRQDALHDYAYNIQDPLGTPISRIDSANHHVVEYGPDHIHRNLSKKQKNQVEPSFTYGFAVADLKVIKQLVEDAEAHWKK